MWLALPWCRTIQVLIISEASEWLLLNLLKILIPFLITSDFREFAFLVFRRSCDQVATAAVRDIVGNQNGRH
jgi:hypothetical protein